MQPLNTQSQANKEREMSNSNKTSLEGRKNTKNNPTNPTNPATTNTNRPATRNETRKTGTSTMIEEHEDIRDATEGRKFLETRLLLCPAGEPVTNSSLSTCLHQIAGMANVPKQATNAIRALAFLVDEMEETTINEIVRDAVISQINELTIDVKSLVEDAKEKIDEHITNRTSEIRGNVPAQSATRPQRSYAEALVSPPPHADPKLAAREGIRARQFMLEGIEDDSKVSHLNAMQLKSEFNRILDNLGLEGHKVRLAIPQRNKGILFEMENDAAACWMNETSNRITFCKAVSPKATIKPRTYSLIAFNVAISFELENQKHHKEVCEANHIDEENITALRWAKPVKRRSPGQKTAHLIMSFADAQAANRAIANGLTFCNRRTHVEKIKKEPIRCLKCQGWNHFAYECILNVDKCGNCAEEHRTSQCPDPHRKFCISCNTDEHASWSRECPTFLRKVSECNRRNPENALQFIPTTESWTWSVKPDTKVMEKEYNPRHENLDFRGYRDPHNPPQNGTRQHEFETLPNWDVPPPTWEQTEPEAQPHSQPPPPRRPNREAQKTPHANPDPKNAT